MQPLKELRFKIIERFPSVSLNEKNKFHRVYIICFTSHKNYT